MNNSGAQRIIPIILVILIIIVAVAALVSVGRSIFGGSSDPVVNTGKEALLNTSLDRSVRLTVRGPIVGDENFHSYMITSTPTARTLTTYEGYLSRQIDTAELPNTSKGYSEFVYALDRAKLMDADELTGDANDLRGVCATGKVYIYQVLQATNIIKTLWTSTCSNARGSLKAPNAGTARLFQAQVPNSNTLINKIKL